MTTPQFTPLTGDDVDKLLAENGGVGEWEKAQTQPIDRWLFPRFPGAENLGTCPKSDNEKGPHVGIHTRVEACGDDDDWMPDPGNMYLSRTGIGPNDTDVETLASWWEAERTMVGATLLLSDPGTGKTALIEAAATHAKRTLTTILCTPDHTKDALLLRYVGDGHGINGGPFTYGPLAHAAVHGHLLYMDEVLLLPDGVKPILYSLSDGRRFLPEGSIDGSPLEIHPDFRLVMSSNPLVRGASLPEPLASRCASTTLSIETSAPLLIDLGIDESIVSAWEALDVAGLWRPAIRELRLADYWLDIDKTQAVSAFLPEHCPDSDREGVRHTVVNYLGGGEIRSDGRLVVA